MVIKIAFHTSAIDIRGTCTALFDYAHYNESILQNQSVILASKNDTKHDKIAIEKFTKRFNVLFYENFDHLEELISDCNIIYFIKYGKNDSFLSKKIKNIIHCVFDMTDPHGDVYAGVSKTLANKFGKELYVPHIVGLIPDKDNKNLRSKLGIPEHATVFGYHGGFECFNINFVKESIKKIVREYKHIYFVFVNIQIFDIHPQIFFLEKITNPDDKNIFISTCDAMIHAQSLGETFGLSIAEFSVNNKKIITYGGEVWNKTYRDILQNNAIYYYNEYDIYNILRSFKKEDYIGKDLNFYREYSPELVMKKFKEVFID